MLKKNIAFMFLSQIVNYLFPLVLVPYLIKVLGLELYGVYVIFQTIIFFALMFTTYSYNITGVKRISINLHDSAKIQQIANNILSTKLVLFLSVSIVFSILPFLIDAISQYKLEFFFIFFNILGYALFPEWYLQGTGNFKDLVLINIVYKFIQFGLIILFVNSQDNFLTLNIIYGFTPLFMALHALKISNINKISFRYQVIANELKKNWRIFLSLFFRNSNSSLIILFIGINFQLETVAVIGAMDKIVKAVRGLFDPVFNVVFQHINKKDIKDKFALIDAMTKFAIIFGLVFFLLFNINQEYISMFLFHKYETTYRFLFLIFSIMPMFLILTNVFGIQTLITYNYERQYNNIMLISFIITLCSIIFFQKNIYYLVSTLPFVETFILISTYLYYKRIKKSENRSRT